MYSSKDEWKEDLSATQLGCVNRLENENDKLTRDKTQLQFQVESLHTQLDTSKLVIEQNKCELKKLERDLEQANVKIEELNHDIEKHKADFKEKESLVLHLNQELNLTKGQRDKEKESKLYYEREIENLKEIHSRTLNKLENENWKIKETQQQEIEDQTSLREKLQVSMAKISMLNEEVAKITTTKNLEMKERQILQTQIDEMENNSSSTNNIDKLSGKNKKSEEVNNIEEQLFSGDDDLDYVSDYVGNSCILG